MTKETYQSQENHENHNDKIAPSFFSIISDELSDKLTKSEHWKIENNTKEKLTQKQEIYKLIFLIEKNLNSADQTLNYQANKILHYLMDDLNDVHTGNNDVAHYKQIDQKDIDSIIDVVNNIKKNQISKQDTQSTQTSVETHKNKSEKIINQFKTINEIVKSIGTFQIQSNKNISSTINELKKIPFNKDLKPSIEVLEILLKQIKGISSHPKYAEIISKNELMQDEAAKINNEEYINNLEKYNINTIIDLKNLFRTITNIGLDLEKTKKLCDDEFGIEKISNLEELYDNQLKEKFDITTFKPERGDKFDETMSIELSEDMSVKDDRFDKKTVVYSFQKGYLFNPLLHQGNNSKGDVLSEATVILYNQNN
jgi:hypothetical protein